LPMRQMIRNICISVVTLAASLQLALPMGAPASAQAAGITRLDLQDRHSMPVEMDGNPAITEQIVWNKRDNVYHMKLLAGGRVIFAKTAPMFFRPMTGMVGDADGDGQQDLVIVWQEEASGGAIRYWLIKGGQAPALVHLSDDYLQGEIELRTDGVYVSYSVFEEGDANAFPSRRVTERWGGKPWRMLARTEKANGRTLMAVEAKSGSNPPLHEIERMLEEVAADYKIPAVLLKAIAWQESNWRQFDSNGNPLVSVDGGIGIMQLTNQTRFDQQRLKTDIRYNIEAGAQVLLEKRSYTKSGLLPPIGSMDMDEMENWYFAIWAYNGWSVYNNPHNIPNKFRKSAAYQDSVLHIARNVFAQPVTRIPKHLIPKDGMPSGKTKYKTPLPIHHAGEDLERRHISIGDTVEVAGLTQTLNVRQSPGLDGRIKDTMQTKERAVVLDGPRERDGYLWYEVNSKDGKGWVAGHYLVAVHDERVSLAELMELAPERLSDKAIKDDGRNLYLQADGMNLSWMDARKNGGLSSALQSYAWWDLWLEWSDGKRSEKPPKRAGSGFLRKVSPIWDERNVSLTEPISLRFDLSKGPRVGAGDFLVLDSRGKPAAITVTSGKKEGDSWVIHPKETWRKKETYTLYYRGFLLSKFTTSRN
jgi:hypothetical protein